MYSFAEVGRLLALPLDERVGAALRHERGPSVLAAPAGLTVIGLQFVGLLGGVVIIEQIFSIPGMGQYMLRALTLPDVPLIMDFAKNATERKAMELVFAPLTTSLYRRRQ